MTVRLFHTARHMMALLHGHNTNATGSVAATRRWHSDKRGCSSGTTASMVKREVCNTAHRMRHQMWHRRRRSCLERHSDGDFDGRQFSSTWRRDPHGWLGGGCMTRARRRARWRQQGEVGVRGRRASRWQCVQTAGLARAHRGVGGCMLGSSPFRRRGHAGEKVGWAETH